MKLQSMQVVFNYNESKGGMEFEPPITSTYLIINQSAVPQIACTVLVFRLADYLPAIVITNTKTHIDTHT